MKKGGGIARIFLPDAADRYLTTFAFILRVISHFTCRHTTMYFNFGLLLFIAPAVSLTIIAQMLISAAYAKTQKMAAKMSGFAAARSILDAAGLNDVEIIEIPGWLTDYYDPRRRVLCLSSAVYHNRSLASVGVAAHEAGHALQQASRYWLFGIRSVAVVLAIFGPNLALALLCFGMLAHVPPFFYFGAILYGGSVFFQLANLPVECDANSRARRQLVDLRVFDGGIIDAHDVNAVNNMLNAAALTSIAASLTAIFTLLDYLLQFLERRRR